MVLPKPQRINSPEPFSLQKMHPFVDIVPSLLGQVKPPSIQIFKVLSPNFSFISFFIFHNGYSIAKKFLKSKFLHQKIRHITKYVLICI